MSIEVSDEDVEAVEDAVGMGSGAWDCIDPKEIIAAAWHVFMSKSDVYRDGLAYRELKQGLADAHKESLGKDSGWDSRNISQ